ncbi:MAG: hypothetical protein LBC30_02830 [Puniceicoccales bacterium]|nr:hypothetical protein [Puniceicoccales bacterium]
MKVLTHFSYPEFPDNSMLSKNENSTKIAMCCGCAVSLEKPQRSTNGTKAER